MQFVFPFGRWFGYRCITQQSHNMYRNRRTLISAIHCHCTVSNRLHTKNVHMKEKPKTNYPTLNAISLIQTELCTILTVCTVFEWLLYLLVGLGGWILSFSIFADTLIELRRFYFQLNDDGSVSMVLTLERNRRIYVAFLLLVSFFHWVVIVIDAHTFHGNHRT